MTVKKVRFKIVIPPNNNKTSILMFEVGDLVFWLSDDHEWLDAIVSDCRPNAICIKRNGIVIKLKNSDKLRQRCISEDVSELSNLSFLHEASILRTLESRFSNKLPYTDACGMVMVVNPFKRYADLYTKELQESYAKVGNTKLAPHIYKISAKAFQNMKKNPQSILVSGESGAGKTESTKIVIDHLANMSAKKENILEQISNSGLILEAFGNAKTSRNDNSSRFGKFINLSYSATGQIIGASVDTYLLEKSRIVTQSKEEANYHIFYQMLRGTLQGDNYLNGDSKFRYLNFPDTAAESHDTGHVTLKALASIGINAESTLGPLLQILSCVLLLGEIEFKDKGDDQSCIEKDADLKTVCELLGVNNSLILEAVLCEKTMTVGSETFKIQLDRNQAIANCDSIAKALYCGVFDWLVSQINLIIGSKQKGDNAIGVLDIFGFESFDTNCLEQLCINYANERLQQLFNESVLKNVQQEYLEEGIEWNVIKYNDGEKVLQLLEGKTKSVFSLLHEECTRPKGKPSNLVSKLISQNESIVVTKILQPHKFCHHSFTVSHFAMPVTYNCQRFLIKNVDSLHRDAHEFLQNECTHELLKAILEFIMPSANSSNGLAVQFKNQLNNLVTTLTATDLQFIRCIKPNSLACCNSFDSQAVSEQLKCSGVMEALRISRAGFPDRLTHRAVLQRWGAFGSLKAVTTELISETVSYLVSSKKSYTVGKTKTYFLASIMEEADHEYNSKTFKYALRCQKHWRKHHCRIRFLIMIENVTQIQSVMRMSIATRNLRIKQCSILKIQSTVRVSLAKRQLQQLCLARFVTKLQATYRMRVDRHRYITDKQSLIKLQAYCRCIITRKQFLKVLRDCRERESLVLLQNKVKVLESQVEILNDTMTASKEIHAKEVAALRTMCKRLKKENNLLKKAPGPSKENKVPNKIENANDEESSKKSSWFASQHKSPGDKSKPAGAFLIDGIVQSGGSLFNAVKNLGSMLMEDFEPNPVTPVKKAYLQQQKRVRRKAKEQTSVVELQAPTLLEPKR